jgi:hypothetical protein
MFCADGEMNITIFQLEEFDPPCRVDWIVPRTSPVELVGVAVTAKVWNPLDTVTRVAVVGGPAHTVA